MLKWRDGDDGSERRNQGAVMTLNAKTENDDSSECQNLEAMVALNAESENDDGSERKNEEMVMMTLNAKTEKWWWLWTPKLRNNNGFERRNWEWWWLWTPKLEIWL